jgi:LysM repeat protein
MGEFDILSVGQPLYIPSVGGTGGPVESDVAAVEAGDEVHEVQPGDTLLTISFRYGVDWQAIAAVNGLGEYDLLQIGQTLALPASVSADGPPSSSRQAANANAEEANAEEADGSSTDDAASETDTSSAESSNAGAGSFTGSYTVQAGDTLSTIAIDFAIDWETLAAANNLSEDDYLQVGQTLVVPGDSLTGATAAEDEEMAAASAARLTLTPITKSYEVEPGDTALAIALAFPSKNSSPPTGLMMTASSASGICWKFPNNARISLSHGVCRQQDRLQTLCVVIAVTPSLPHPIASAQSPHHRSDGPPSTA